MTDRERAKCVPRGETGPFDDWRRLSQFVSHAAGCISGRCSDSAGANRYHTVGSDRPYPKASFKEVFDTELPLQLAGDGQPQETFDLPSPAYRQEFEAHYQSGWLSAAKAAGHLGDLEVP